MADENMNEVSASSFEARLYDAIRVQRPAVIAHIRTVRRAKPGATPAEAIKTLESGYLAAVTSASAAVGGTAAIPAVGTSVALGLSAADLLLFFELSALYSLSIAEVHGLTVSDPERAKVLVIGMVVGGDGRKRVGQMVANAVAEGVADKGAVGLAGDVAKATAAARDGQWGDVVATAVPEKQLNPLVKQIVAAGAGKLGARLAAGRSRRSCRLGLVRWSVGLLPSSSVSPSLRRLETLSPLRRRNGRAGSIFLIWTATGFLIPRGRSFSCAKRQGMPKTSPRTFGPRSATPRSSPEQAWQRQPERPRGYFGR